jgi:cytochrome P450
VRAEIDAVTSGGDLQAEHLSRLELLDAVIKEGLRINPVLDDVGRIVKQPIEIGGWRIPAGVAVAPQIHLVHHREDLYPEPERFDPDRFLRRRVSPYEFLPFGGGARRCIGMAFALYEMKVVLARVFGRTDLRLASARPARPVRRAITLVPSRGVPVILSGAASA